MGKVAKSKGKPVARRDKPENMLHEKQDNESTDS